MSPLTITIRRLCLCLGSAALFSLGVSVLGSSDLAHGQDAARSAGTAGNSGTKGSIKENIKQLGREVTDPGTLQRIKAHEQALENKIERRRDRQRKDHGNARPSDAVDLVKNLDKPDAAADPPPAKRNARAGGKNRVEAAPPQVPPAPAPPAAAKTPARQ